jgi:hypothetical protein
MDSGLVAGLLSQQVQAATERNSIQDISETFLSFVDHIPFYVKFVYVLLVLRTSFNPIC